MGSTSGGGCRLSSSVKHDFGKGRDIERQWLGELAKADGAFFAAVIWGFVEWDLRWVVGPVSPFARWCLVNGLTKEAAWIWSLIF